MHQHYRPGTECPYCPDCHRYRPWFSLGRIFNRENRPRPVPALTAPTAVLRCCQVCGRDVAVRWTQEDGVVPGPWFCALHDAD